MQRRGDIGFLLGASSGPTFTRRGAVPCPAPSGAGPAWLSRSPKRLRGPSERRLKPRSGSNARGAPSLWLEERLQTTRRRMQLITPRQPELKKTTPSAENAANSGCVISGCRPLGSMRAISFSLTSCLRCAPHTPQTCAFAPCLRFTHDLLAQYLTLFSVVVQLGTGEPATGKTFYDLFNVAVALPVRSIQCAHLTG